MKQNQGSRSPNNIQELKAFERFTLGQRWEHLVLLICVIGLLLTGLPQKYRLTSWSQQILSTPEKLYTIQQIHHIVAIILVLEVLYHLINVIFLLTKRKLPGDIFPNVQDFSDAGQMIKFLLFISNKKPSFGKYNFEQKITYWFLFFTIGIMVLSGLILWFPIFFTRFLPGGIIPAAKLSHSTEAMVALIFVVLWHFYHVHIERLNLSIFTGWLNEHDMRSYHALEYKRLMDDIPDSESVSHGEET